MPEALDGGELAAPLEERGWNGPWPARRRSLDALLIALLLLAAFAMREWHLGAPPNRYFDETYYVKSAYEYLAGKPDTNTVHPPLGKMIIACCLRLYQVAAPPLARWGLLDSVTESAGWRLGSLLAGLCMIPLTYALAFRLFRSRFVAVTASALLMLDPLHIVQSRIAMLDMFMALFVLAGAYGAWRFVETPEPNLGWATFTALAFSLGAACKWNALFAGLGAFVVMLMLRPYPPRTWRRWCAGLTLLFALLVPTIYLISFLPFFQHGTSLPERRERLIANHKLMFTFRYSKDFKHRYMSHFWDWPTVLRPVWYHYQEYSNPHGSVFPQRTDSWATRLLWRGRKPEQYISGVVAIGSPFVWLTFLIFFVLTLGQSVVAPLAAAVVQAVRPPPGDPPADLPADLPTALPEADPGDAPPTACPPEAPPRAARNSFWHRLMPALDAWRLGFERPWIFLVALYLPQILLWSVNKGFLFYVLPCIPFMTILVAAVLNEWMDLSLGRTCIALYLAIAIGFALAYYPLLTAYPIPRPWYELLIPTNRWI